MFSEPQTPPAGLSNNSLTRLKTELTFPQHQAAPHWCWGLPSPFLTALLVFQNQLSGNLLRKFKNSNGWQKLWVVFTNFCLFFYKSHQVHVSCRAGGPVTLQMMYLVCKLGRA